MYELQETSTITQHKIKKFKELTILIFSGNFTLTIYHERDLIKPECLRGLKDKLERGKLHKNDLELNFYNASEEETTEETTNYISTLFSPQL